ncbi:MAG: hypothetical protein GH150_01370 [Hadesarchaea archaeon]|nr:hypothetical protein [Hadesarchaea archaeon]
MVKDIHSDINLSQRKRGYMFQKLNSKITKEIQVADGKKFEFSRTTLEFSKPVFHGAADSQLGYVLMLTVRTPVCSFMHASDVQGPIDEEALRLILKQMPDMLVMGGPPLYLKNFKIDEESLANALNNMVKIVKAIPLTVIDHHILRSLDYKEYLTPVFAEAEKSGHRVISASELVGQEPQLLEAKRKELHARGPIKRK